MHSFHARAVDGLLLDAASNDSEALVSACIVNMTIRFSAIMTSMYAKGQDKLSDEERGVVFDELKFIINNLMVLYHATDTEPPDSEGLTDYAQEAFPAELMVDGVLCSIHCLGAIADLAAIVYDPELDDEEDHEEVFEDVEQSLVEIYAGVISLSYICEIDFDELMLYAAGLKENEQDWSVS